MHTAREYAFLTPSSLGRRRYRGLCRRLDLDPVPGGYGALLCCDREGRRMTVLTTDLDYLRMVVDAVREACRLREGEPSSGMPVNSAKFPLRRSGDLAAVLDEHRLRGRRRRGLRRGCGVAR